MNNLQNKTYRFLRWTEKWTKTDMVYLSRGGLWLTLGKVISTLASFVLAVAFANLLPQEVYGNYKYILSIVSILTIPTLRGIDTAVTIAVAKGREGSIYPAIKAKISWGAIGSVAALAMASYYFFGGNYILTINLLIAAVFLPFIDTLSIYNSYLSGKRKFKQHAQCLSLVKIIATIPMVLVVFLSDNIYLIIATYFISYTVLRLIFLITVLKKLPPNKEIDPDTIPYGKHLSILDLLGTIVGEVDKILAFHFLGAVQLAIYSMSLAIPQQIKGIFSSIDSLILPKFSKKNKEETKKAIESKFATLFFIVVAIIVAYILIVPIVYKVFFPKYLDSILISQIFFISMIKFAFAPYSIALKTQKKIKAQYIGRTINSAIQLILMVALILPWGLIGLVIARVITQIFGNLVNVGLYYYTYYRSKPNTDQSGGLN